MRLLRGRGGKSRPSIGARRRRIAKGSGTTVQEVNSLLKQYAQMRKMMKSFTGGGFLGKRLGKLKLPMGFGS